MLRCIKVAELPVADQDRAIHFYTEKVGLKVVQDARYQDDWRWVELEIAGAETRIVLTKRSDKDETDAPRMVLVADDVNQTYQDLKKRGVNFTKEPAQAPWNPAETFAQFRDSEGNGIVISSGG
jgi:predicted enzyme related to lactoylglutathione lyase